MSNKQSPKRVVLTVSIAVALVLLCIGAWGINRAGLLASPRPEAPQSLLAAEPQRTGPTLLRDDDRPAGSLLQSQGDSPSPFMMSSAPAESPAPRLDSSSSAAPQALASEGQASPPAMAAEPAPAGMPDDVREWLEHLRITEGKREQLASRQVSEAVSMLFSMVGGNLGSVRGALEGGDGQELPRNPEGPQQVAQDTSRMKNDWGQLSRFFNSKTPPAECLALARTYSQVVNETANMIQEIVSIVANVGDNPMGAVARLQSMAGTSASRIDAAADKADRSVAEICERYKTDKWFSIRKDFGENALGKLGM